MSANKALWDSVKMTDPDAVKPITGKQYRGNSPKPYWLIERATEVFGPVGIGWGVEVKSERFERLSDTDVLHVAVVSVWFVKDGVRSHTFDQMGGTKACYKTSKGPLMVDEDAGKKSVTDGMVKCLSMIGFAGDIFSGQWDDSKYVEQARQHFNPAADDELQDFDARDPFSVFTPAQAKKVREVAAATIQAFSEGNEYSAYEEYSTFLAKATTDESRTNIQLALSLVFKPHSALRTAIKKYEAEDRKTVTQ